MKKKKLYIATAAVIILSITLCGGIKIGNKVKLDNAVENFAENVKNGDIVKAQEIYEIYCNNTSFIEKIEYSLNENGKSEIQKIVDSTEIAVAEKSKDNVNSLISLGYVVTSDDKSTIKNEYNRLYTLCYQNKNIDDFTLKKIDVIKSIDNNEILSNDTDFFQEQFNTIMSDLITSRISKEFALNAYSLLSPLYAENRTFAEGRVDQIYTSYNNGDIKYEAAVNIFDILKSSGIAATKANEKTDEIKELWNSKTAFNTGVNAMNVNDYINAFENFNKVIEKDTNYSQKNSYVNEMLPKAKQEAFNKITTYCNAHDYASARNVITTYDKYLNSAELRDKNKNIDEAEESYKKAVERQNQINQVKNAIRIRKIVTSKPNSAGGVDLKIYWTNKSNKTIKYVNFYVQAYNAVNDPVSSEIGWSARQGVQVTGPVAPYANYGEGEHWENVWYNSTIKYAKVMVIDITYIDGTQVHFYDDVASYATY